jgi:hypothetical protein
VSAVTALLGGALVLGSGSALALLPAQIAGAATDTVTNCNDSGAGSLRATIAAATAGDTVNFSVGCSTITLTSGMVEITQNLTISGPGASTLAVSGNSASTVFQVDPGVTLDLSGLTVENGYDVSLADATPLVGSGGIYVNQGTLDLSSATLTNNTSPNGAAIYNNAGTVTVTDSTITRNFCFGYGDVVGFDSGCAVYNAGADAMLTVTSSDITSNGSTGDSPGHGSGGIENAGGYVAVTNTTLNGDSGAYYGGLVSNDSGGKVYLTTDLLTGGAASDGGAIFNDVGFVSVLNSTVAANTTELGTGGGGIFNEGAGGGVAVTNSTVADNSDQNGAGNDIYNAGPSPVDLQASLVAEPVFTPAGSDCTGTMTDLGYNLDDDGSCGLVAATSISNHPSGLDSSGLADHGGPTQTIALLTGPAIGHVAVADCPATDQRGVARANPCAIGAYEPHVTRLLNIWLINPHYWIWPDPPLSPNAQELGSLGYLLPDGGKGLLGLFGCQDGTAGNFLSVDQSGACEASSHPGVQVTSLGIAGFIYASPPTDGTATAPLYRCVGANAPTYTSLDYLETTEAPVDVGGVQRCGQDPADFAFDSQLGYIVTSPSTGLPEVPVAAVLPLLAVVLMAGAVLLGRRRRHAQGA